MLTLKKELWKDVKGYEGLYQVSNAGRVRAFKSQAILKEQVDHRNRKKIMLHDKGKRKNCSVHRLVALAFIENPENYPEINHKDGNTWNNRVENLEWCNHSYNAKHAYHTGLLRTIRGRNEKSKKPIIRSDGKRYDCAYEAASDLGVTVYSIRDILKGRIKTCRGFSFSYE